MTRHPLSFATFAGTQQELHHALVLADSIRTFAGALSAAPIAILVPRGLLTGSTRGLERAAGLGVTVQTGDAPAAETLPYPFAHKVFAAAAAEGLGEERSALVVWMDSDTAVLQEPREFLLQGGVVFGYRPVMHRLIGSAASETPDAYWSRIYAQLTVPETALVPMLTVADRQRIRPYFNAGLLVVRPERGLLRRWAQAFLALCRDPILDGICEQDRQRKLFLHQAALAGAVLAMLRRDEMVQLPDSVNYPLLFHEMFESTRSFDDLDGVVTARFELLFWDIRPRWNERLRGPADRVSWLNARLTEA